MSLANKIKTALINLPGKRIKDKIVVFESDDWGSIRMPNRSISSRARAMGINIESSSYTLYDTLASSNDLQALFDVLSEFKDFSGNHPIITFNTVTANPNFELIAESNFKQYYYEPFTNTLEKYYPKENVFELWQEGIKNGLIQPQFHGREHVNVNLWLELLKAKVHSIQKSFELGFWGVGHENYKEHSKIKLQATYDTNTISDLDFHKGSIASGLHLFESIFGFRSISFIPNNFIFHKELLKNTLLENGVNVLQGMKYHVNPLFGNEKREYKRRKNGFDGEFYNLVRNCVFEPSQEKSKNDVVNTCLAQISNAFSFRKPAIITAHRLNFIGSLDEKNRKENLDLFRILLAKIIEKWPDVQFFSSDDYVKRYSTF